LLEVIKSPVQQHLPPDSIRIAFSTKAKLIPMAKFAKSLNNSQPVVFVVGAVAKGNPTMEVDYIQESVCISKYALSASVCLGRIMNTYEEIFGIV